MAALQRRVEQNRAQSDEELPKEVDVQAGIGPTVCGEANENRYRYLQRTIAVRLAPGTT